MSRLVVEAVHLDQLREHGGLPGLRDENALEAALARPHQKWHCDADTDHAILRRRADVDLRNKDTGARRDGRGEKLVVVGIDAHPVR